MKNTITILAFIINQIVFCQITILPLATYENISNGAYLKDLDNAMLPYVGNWEGTLNNKKYTFNFIKFQQHLKNYPNGEYYYQDELLGNFKVTDLLTNVVLYNNLSATNYEDFRIIGNPVPRRGVCFFTFTDTDANCLNGLKFMLRKIKGQPNQLTFCDFRYDDFWKFWDCPAYPDRNNIPIFMPKQDFTLTKI